MKFPILLAALLAGSAAFAQPPAETPPPAEVAPAAEAPAPEVPAPAADPSANPAAQLSAPSNEAPAPDNAGTPVVSDPAQVPAGFNQAPGTPGIADASQPPAPQPATRDYPRCSRTVTDNCVQSEGRSRRRGPA